MTESNSHLRGQYLIVLNKKNLDGRLLSGFEKQVGWKGFTIFADASLHVAQASSEAANVLLIGYAVHYEYHDFSDEELLSWMVSRCRDAEDMIRLLQDCGGRYVALIEDKIRTVAVTDSCAMRQLYWFGDKSQLILSSSPRLILEALGQQPEIDATTSDLLNNEAFRATEYAWYGDKWYDYRINKVIANHYLNIKTVTVHRTGYYYDGPTAYGDILDYAAKILTGLIASIHYHHRVIQALTSGYDSRVLLAASRNFRERTQYYVFDSGYALNRSADIKVAAGLCKNLALSFEVIMPGKLREDFLAEYRKKCFFPRIISNTPHIQWHYDFNRNRRILNINGNCGEIARFFFQNKAGKRDDIGHLIKIAGFNRFFAPQIKSWYSDSIEFCSTSGIGIYDLFYWEQRMSNWGAMYRFEQDIAIEEFTPYNHKNLLLALLHVDLKKRKGPRYTLFRDLIVRMWPETLSFPFNPVVGLQIKSRAKKIAKIILGKK